MRLYDKNDVDVIVMNTILNQRLNYQLVRVIVGIHKMV